MDFSLKFLGGLATTENLTGSCTAVEVRYGKKTTSFLIDVGLVQGDFKNFLRNNARILDSIEPAKIDFVIITHAHVDHTGLLPLLANKGFKGRIICTRETADLLPIMLADSYKVQSELAARTRMRETASRSKNKQEQLRRKTSQLVPKNGLLFTSADVERAIALICQSGFAYKTPIKLTKEIVLKFYPSGHILGGAIGVLEIANPQSKRKFHLGFSGDLGRQEGLLLRPPAIVKEPINLWLTESTYGDKNHPERKTEIDRLCKLIAEAQETGKKIIIPAFALQRTQEIIFLLTAAMQNEKIPKLPIFLDSPMAIKLTEVFAKHWDLGTFQTKDRLAFNPFSGENPYLKFVREPEESAQLVAKPGPLIVIASSGMCDAGRIRDHLRAGLPHQQAIVCIIGYMAPTSLGRKLKDGAKAVKMNDREIAIEARIENFESFSAHADSSELAAYAGSVMPNSVSTGRIVVILHGEISGGQALKEKLGAEFQGRGISIIVPEEREVIKIKL